MSKDMIIRLLLRTYPHGWRSEYGEELSAILADRSFTPLMIGDVVLCGVGQRLRCAEAWQMGGIALALWLIAGTAINSFSPLSPSAYNHFFQINLLIEMAIGYIYVAHGSRRPGAAALASAKASLLGIIPELLLAALWAAHLIHPTILGMNGSPHLRGSVVTELCLRTEATASPVKLLLAVPCTVAPAFFLGFIGAVLAKGSSTIRRYANAQND
jgi:hypothetical protein